MAEDSSLEIERKFLVAQMPSLNGLARKNIMQGYFTQPDDSAEIRLRRANDECFITVKSKGDIQRMEHETPITPLQFSVLWPATAGRRFEKTRWVGQLADGHCFELDLFGGALSDLKLVEVEFDSLDAARRFHAPAWFGEEVSSNPLFKGQAIAMRARETAADPAP